MKADMKVMSKSHEFSLNLEALTEFAMSSPHLRSYEDRAQKHGNPAAQALLYLMEKKKSNLSVSVDVTRKKDFLAIIDAVGPYVCLIKASLFPPSLKRCSRT